MPKSTRLPHRAAIPSSMACRHVRRSHEQKDLMRYQNNRHATWHTRIGNIVLRMSHPDDAHLMQDLMRRLSSRSRFLRFFYAAPELTPAMIGSFTRNAPTETMTLLAVVEEDGQETVIAMAQYSVAAYPERCNFAVVVADDWQRRGVGTRLIQTLIDIARAAGIERFEDDVLAENQAMLQLMSKLGFTIVRHEEDSYLRKVRKGLSLLSAGQGGPTFANT
jgi:RimJ/RimL family protein N-acetyltransferase